MTDNQDSIQGGRAKKVAVIAVHGISDQKPYASARAIADLLLTKPTQSNYTPFNERFIRMKVEPLKAQAKVEIEAMTGWNISIIKFLNYFLPGKWSAYCSHLCKLFDERGPYMKRLWQSFDERGPYMKQLLTGKPRSPNDPLTQPDYLFMRDKIDTFDKPSVYNTICLEGYCTATESQAEPSSKIQVHIYEMYWADRIRLGTGFFSIFRGLYQLFFRLGNLGLQSVDLMRAERQVRSRNRKFGDFLNIWAWYSVTQSFAGRILSLLLPILNLYLLIAALIGLLGTISKFTLGIRLLVAVSIGLLLIIIGGYILFQAQNKIPYWNWLFLLFGLGLALEFVKIPVIATFSNIVAFYTYRLITLEWVALLSIAIWFFVIKPYSRYRPGAEFFGIAVGFPLGIAIFRLVCTAPNSLIGIIQVSLNMIEIIYFLLVCGWLFFWLLYFSTVVCSSFSIISIPKFLDNERTLAKHAARTARLSLALPALLFSLITIPLWTALVNLSITILPTEVFYKPKWFLKNYQSAFNAAEFSKRLTDFSGSIIAVDIIVLTILVLVLLIWALAPSILTEIFPPDPKSQNPKRLIKQGLGNWLNNGFKFFFEVADWIICWMIPLLFLMAIVDTIVLLGGTGAENTFASYSFSHLLPFLSFLNINSSFADKILILFVSLLLGSTAILFVFTGRFNQIFVSLRGAIDSVLDVDNYLRLHPREENPSARIYARYTSLLRYLCSQSPLDGEPYDAIIIVAHSQGTVISADLLRFLKIDPDPILKDAKAANNIYFFTMGSPIRQLYGYAFPHLYRWAIQEPASTATTLDLSSNANPSPKELFGVRKWVNTFRSGDYVGRYLWRSNHVADQWMWMKGKLEPPQYISEDPDCTRREFCLGEGAHTHYWDKYAPEVAWEIDRLIRDC